MSIADTSTTNLTPDPENLPLYQRVVRGGFWIFALRLMQQLLAMGRLFVLMWLLAPRDFGMLGIALLTMAILTTFTQTGFQFALIQKQKETGGYLNAAWTVGLIRGGVLFTILFFIAPVAVFILDQKPDFKSSHIDQPLIFISRLQAGSDPLSREIRENLSPRTMELFTVQSEDQDGLTSLKDALSEDLNNIIQTQNLFRDDIINSLNLTEHNQKRVVQYQQNDETVRINRLLLEQAYPDALKEVLLDRLTGTRIIQVIGLTFLLGALSNIGIIYFAKELEFHKQFIYEICGVVTNVTITITLACLYRSVWALVIGKLAGQLVQTILSYVLHSHRPRLCWDKDKIAELWRFGKWVLGSSILGFLITQGDDIFVAKLLGASALGLYQVAYRFAVMPAQEITQVISKVTFPAYAKMQDNLPRLRDAYLKVMKLTAFLSLPLGGLILILSPEVIRLFFKEDWEPIIPILQILIIWGTLSSMGALTGALFNAVGKPKLAARFQIFKLLLLASLIYPFTIRWNLSGTAIAVVISAVSIQPFLLHTVFKIIRCRLKDLTDRIFFPLTATLVMIGMIALGKYLIFTEIRMPTFFILVLLGLTGYLGAIFIFDRFCGYGIKSLLMEQARYL